MEITLLLRLLIAHLLTDFVFQPKSWVKDRELKQGKSVKLYLHVTITAAVAYVFSGEYANWIIPLVIFSTHLGIDYIKSKTEKDNFSYFVADQLAHILVILLLWLTVENQWTAIPTFIRQLFGTELFWIIAAGYIFVSWPLGIIIGKATQQWRDQINREKSRIVMLQPSPGEEQELGLANAGKWIGICERLLILTFVLMGQFTAIGFFNDGQINSQVQ